jgi:hypothetical protein
MLTTLVTLVVYLVIIGLIFYGLGLVLSQIPLPDPFATVIRVLMVLIALLIVVYLLLGIIPGNLRLPALH